MVSTELTELTMWSGGQLGWKERGVMDNPTPQTVIEHVTSIRQKLISNSSPDGTFSALINILAAVKDLASCVEELRTQIDS